VDALRSVLMVRMGNAGQLEATPEELEKLKSMADRFALEKLLAAVNAFDRVAQQPSLGWQPGLQLELALTRLAAEPVVAEKAQEPRPAQAAKVERTENRPAQTPPAQKAVEKPATPNIVKEEIKIDKTAEEKAEKTEEKKADKQEEVKAEPQPSAVEKTESMPEAETGIEAKPAEVETQPAPPAAEGDLARINESWKDIRSVAKDLSAETGALLNSCRTVTSRKGRLVLGFSSELLRSKMENGHNQDNARKAIRQVTGIDVMIDCRVAGKEEPAIPDGVDRDSMVGTALSLGGKITKNE